MKFLAMIQARCGSSRLPSKVLKDLCGRTVLEHVIQKSKKKQVCGGGNGGYYPKSGGYTTGSSGFWYGTSSVCW